MPFISKPISGLTQTVERPVVYAVIRQLMDITQISHRTPIRFYGNEGFSAQQSSTITGTSQANGAQEGLVGERSGADGIGQNRWPHMEQVSITVKDTPNPDRFGAFSVRRRGVAPIFEDGRLGIYVRPTYRNTLVNIRIDYKAADKNQADMWRTRLMELTELSSELQMHQVQYRYEVDEYFQKIICHLYDLREKQGGYGQDLSTYLSEHFPASVSMIANFNGKEKALVVTDNQGSIQGKFDFPIIPEEAEKDGDSSSFIVSCNYTFTYEKPVSMSMQYPITVHNQRINKKLLPIVKNYNPLDANPQFTISSWAAQATHSGNIFKSLLADDGLQIPPFDEWRPSDVIWGTVRVFSALCSITPENKRTLLNLGELGAYGLEPQMLEFIRGEREGMTRSFYSIFALSLYENNSLVEYNRLELKENLDVVATSDLDIRKTYHVRLGLHVEPKALQGEALERVYANYEIARRLAMAIDGSLRNKGGVSGIYKNRLRGDEYEAMGLKYEGGYGPIDEPITGFLPGTGRTMNERHWKLTQVFFIEAGHKR